MVCNAGLTRARGGKRLGGKATLILASKKNTPSQQGKRNFNNRPQATTAKASARASSYVVSAVAGEEKKELYCVAKETNADGSTLFKFSEDKPVEKPKVEEEKKAPVPEPEPEPEPKAVKDMTPKAAEKKPQGFGKKKSDSSVQPAVIIGAGRVGQALADMGGGADLVLKRGDKFPADAPAGPIIVCTRNDVLDDVVFGIPPGRWADLVFLQNGVLQPWLEEKGLQNCTQMLAYFAVAKLGENPTDGVTELNPEGLTSATGKWAQAMADRLHSADLSCHVLSKEDYEVRMFEKLIWICSFMIVGASHGGCSVGEVAASHRGELSDIIGELAGIATSTSGVAFPAGLVDRLVAYGNSVAHFPTAMKEFEWRNGFFYKISQKALSAGGEDPAPFHSKLLFQLTANS